MNEPKNNLKYKAILKTGKGLFWKHGIKRVTIEEICTEASVSKMTFYKFFSNKIELAKIMLRQIMEESSKQFNEILESDLPFTEKINRIILLKFEATKNISAEFINDLSKNQEYGLYQLYGRSKKNKR